MTRLLCAVAVAAVVLFVPADPGVLIVDGFALVGAWTVGCWLWRALGPLYVDEPTRLPIDLDGGMRRRHQPTER